MARKREEQPSGGKPVSQQQPGGACGGSSGGSSSGGSGTGSAGNKAMNNTNPGTAYESLKQQLATLGLAMREIPGDGNCLFGALADQMDGSRATHSYYRQKIVKYMRQNRLHFEPFVEDDVSFHEHMRRMSELGTFGGNECIVAFARLHNVAVVIHQLNTAFWTISGSDEADNSGGDQLCEVHISYHNGDHYNSVRIAGDCSLAPAKIRLEVLTSNAGWHLGSGKQTANTTSRPDLAHLENLLMQYTGCQDYTAARHCLQAHDYNLDEAVEALIDDMQDPKHDKQDDEEEEEEEDDTDPLQRPTLWSEGGSGYRVLGHEASALAMADTGSKPYRMRHTSPGLTPAVGVVVTAADKLQQKLTQPHISNTKRKGLKKQLRKHHNMERKKLSDGGDRYFDCEDGTCPDNNVIIANNFTSLSI